METDQTNNLSGTSRSGPYYGTDGDDVFDLVDGVGDVYGSAGFDIVKIPGGPDDYKYFPGKGGFSLTNFDGGRITSSLRYVEGRLEANELFVFLETGHSFSSKEVFEYYRANKPNFIEGTSDADYLFGTEGNDDIRLREGVDVVNGSAGNDQIDGGGEEYNQVDYDGKPSDYTFTNATSIKNRIIVEKPNGTDVLSDIDGIWFKEDQWYSIEDLLAANGQPNLIFGTRGEDYLFGTDGDDVIDLDRGVDVMNGSAGNDVIKGSEFSYDQIDYDGKAANYTFSKNQDGSITVQKPNGTDTLTDINGIWFKEGQWYEIDDLLENDFEADSSVSDEF